MTNNRKLIKILYNYTSLWFCFTTNVSRETFVMEMTPKIWFKMFHVKHFLLNNLAKGSGN